MQPKLPEHKLITILFADIVGSTELTGRMGAETARVVLDRSLQRMGGSVEEYGGTVARYEGDGLLAFFGAPLAHEDDPERAGLAALKMHEAVRQYAAELGEDLHLRVGINTGRAVMGGETVSETVATGKPVVLAKRLESAAQPDETLLGETTTRLTRHRFELESAGQIDAKGFDEPQPATRLLGELAHPSPARGVADLHSPLVGRTQEHKRLKEVLSDLQGGRGCIVTIVGEPGIGKSRLLLEARETHRDVLLQWAEGRAYSYTEDQPFSVILDFLAELLEIAPDDAPAVLDLKLETAIRPLLGEQTEEVWPYLASLLGAPIPIQYAEALEQMDAETLGAKIVNAVILLIEATAARRPLVLAFEDLHWADHSSLSLIQSLMMATERAPILLIFLFRDDRDKPCWELKLRAETEFAHRYAHLPLAPLDDPTSRQLIENLLALSEVSEHIGALVQSRSEGNPFFVEELIRELIERGILVRSGEKWRSSQEVAMPVVPETLEKVIQARLDRLPLTERSTLQAASVIGRRFPFRVLEAVVGADGDLREHLLHFQQADLVRERTRIPELEYIFKHVVVQEVTYATLVGEQREQLHRNVAQTILDLFPERLEEQHGALARHYAAAGETALAMEHYERAADRADEIFAYEEAAHFLEQALEVATDPETRAELLEREADLRVFLGENLLAMELYQEAMELIDPTDKWSRVRLLRKLAESITGMSNYEDRFKYDNLAFKSLTLANEQIEDESPNPESVRVLLGWFPLRVRTIAGRQDWNQAEAKATVALEMAKELEDGFGEAEALARFEAIYHRQDKFKEQTQAALRRLEISRDPRYRDPRVEGSALLAAGVGLKNWGRYQEAIAYLDEAEQLAARIHDYELLADSLGAKTECWFQLDNWDEVVKIETRLLGLHKRYGIDRLGPICFYLGFSASVNALRGERDRARELREESYEIMTTASGVSEEEWVRSQHY